MFSLLSQALAGGFLGSEQMTYRRVLAFSIVRKNLKEDRSGVKGTRRGGKGRVCVSKGREGKSANENNVRGGGFMETPELNPSFCVLTLKLF